MIYILCIKKTHQIISLAVLYPKHHRQSFKNILYMPNYFHYIVLLYQRIEMARTRDDFPIERSERYRFAQNTNSVQLALDNVQREDAGHYTLTARTETGKLSRKDIELIVEDRSTGDDPPVFVRRLGDLSVKVGTRTRLLVEIRTSSPVKVNKTSKMCNCLAMS